MVFEEKLDNHVRYRKYRGEYAVLISFLKQFKKFFFHLIEQALRSVLAEPSRYQSHAIDLQINDDVLLLVEKTVLCIIFTLKFLNTSFKNFKTYLFFL